MPEPKPPNLPSLEPTASSGIEGFNQILGGGYSAGRTTLIRGASGSGKTLFSLMFSAASSNNHPVVYASFEEPVEYLKAYLAQWHSGQGVNFLDFTPDPDATSSGGAAVDFGAILIRLENALERTGARFLVLDAFDNLFSSYENEVDVRNQLFKIFRFCRSKEITLLATAGIDSSYKESTGILDYASDCSILLSQQLKHGLMTRKLRVLKLRGRAHGTNEYPFLIDSQGISVLPVTDTKMDAPVSHKRLSTGNTDLDAMLGGEGIWRGSTCLISGQSGTGKSLIASTIAASAARQGLKVLYTSFEESPAQFLRDIDSAGIQLQREIDAGNLILAGIRPVEMGLEEHLILLLRQMQQHEPDLVVLDPISSLTDLVDTEREMKSGVLRLCHALKTQGITLVLTELLPDDVGNVSRMNISSIIDSWIRLERRETNDTMERLIRIHKSRGAETSNRIHKFSITGNGIAVQATQGTK